MEEQDRKLLERFKPWIAYDSLEAYFAGSPELMTDNPGTRLVDEHGKLIVNRWSGLGLGYLGAHYPDGTKAKPTDRLSIQGRDYRTQYSTLVGEQSELDKHVYGRVHHGPGRIWLQYWFFYFYDDPTLAAHLGAHEGDWEMIQLRIPDGRNDPDQAVYAQHDYASRTSWREVDKRDDRPVVYSARGSHASYFKAGVYDTKAWLDVADGRGRTDDPALSGIDDTGPAWVLWPGRWGDTSPRAPWLTERLKFLKGVEADSPNGPREHKTAWNHPDKVFDDAKKRVEPPTQRPEVPVRLDQLGSRLRVRYDLGPAGRRPVSWLIVNVKSGGAPPRSFTIYVGRRRRGRWIVPWLELGTHEYEIWVSLMGADGTATIASCTEFVAEAQRWHRRFGGWVGEHVARFVQWVRGLAIRARSGASLTAWSARSSPSSG